MEAEILDEAKRYCHETLLESEAEELKFDYTEEVENINKILQAGLSGYPVSGSVSGKLSSQYPVPDTSTSTGFKPGSWFSVIHCIYPLTCLYVTSSLWCAVGVTGSDSQDALSGKLRSRQAALTVTVGRPAAMSEQVYR